MTVEELSNDIRFQSYVIDKVIPFPKMLEQAGYEGYSYNGKCFCPMHDNENTPAAKIFHDAQGDTLWCFSEQRRYYPSDVLKKGMVKGKTVTSIFTRLWGKLSSDTQNTLVEGYGKPVSIIPQSWVDNEYKLSLFKQGKVSLDQHLKFIKTIL